MGENGDSEAVAVVTSFCPPISVVLQHPPALRCGHAAGFLAAVAVAEGPSGRGAEESVFQRRERRCVLHGQDRLQDAGRGDDSTPYLRVGVSGLGVPRVASRTAGTQSPCSSRHEGGAVASPLEKASVSVGAEADWRVPRKRRHRRPPEPSATHHGGGGWPSEGRAARPDSYGERSRIPQATTGSPSPEDSSEGEVEARRQQRWCPKARRQLRWRSILGGLELSFRSGLADWRPARGRFRLLRRSILGGLELSFRSGLVEFFVSGGLEFRHRRPGNQ